MAEENRKYKDSLFCDLFYSDRDAKANLLSLYNALHGTDYTDEAMIELVRPEFYTFYNGSADYPMETKMHLSCAYPPSDEKPMLELTVKIININSNKNNPLLTDCRVMWEYSRFVEATRKYKGDKNALEEAIRECIANGILTDYLTRKGSEVINMLMEEYDYDTDIAVQREEAAAESEKRGEERGIKIGERRGEKRGIEIGEERGMDAINQLNVALIADNRMEDLKRSTEDSLYQEQLLKEYHIGKYSENSDQSDSKRANS